MNINDYCVVDIETTGLSKYRDEIIEIGCVKVRNHLIVDEFNILIKPTRPISSYITSINGITNDMVKDGCSIEEAMIQFYDFVGEDIIVGHNVSFDMGFISHHAQKRLGLVFENIVMDTMKLARRNVKAINYKLSTLCDYYGIKNKQAHRALSDVYATYELFEKLIKKHDSK